MVNKAHQVTEIAILGRPRKWLMFSVSDEKYGNRAVLVVKPINN